MIATLRTPPHEDRRNVPVTSLEQVLGDIINQTLPRMVKGFALVLGIKIDSEDSPTFVFYLQKKDGVRIAESKIQEASQQFNDHSNCKSAVIAYLVLEEQFPNWAREQPSPKHVLPEKDLNWIGWQLAQTDKLPP